LFFYEVDSGDCSVFLADLTARKEKHASKCEELDEVRVKLAELQSRPTLLGACTSCLLLRGKLAKSHSRIVSLEAELKAFIPTSCSTCELHVFQNLELSLYVDQLQDENNDLIKMMGWLSDHEPQLRMMIEA
jgi:hypothetical protein